MKPVILMPPVTWGLASEGTVLRILASMEPLRFQTWTDTLSAQYFTTIQQLSRPEEETWTAGPLKAHTSQDPT